MADTPTVEVKRCLDELCRDHAAMSLSERRPDQRIVVDEIDLRRPATTGLSVSLIANRLITNAIKHGKGRITVKLAQTGTGMPCPCATVALLCQRVSTPLPATAWE